MDANQHEFSEGTLLARSASNEPLALTAPTSLRVILFSIACLGLPLALGAQPNATTNDTATGAVVASPVWEINAGVVFTGTPKNLNLPLTARTWGTGKTIARLVTSCDCLALKTKLPLDIADTKTTPLEFTYTPKDIGGWNVEIILELVTPTGLETQRAVLYGTTCDPAWRIGAVDALALQKSGKAQIIDLRDDTAWNAAHAAGALHLRPGELLRNRALKARPLVLIGENLTDDTALMAASQLRQKGFSDVRIVAGGLAAWVAANGIVNGTDTTRAQSVSVAEITTHSLTAEWTPIFIGTQATAPALPNAVEFSATTPPSDIAVQLSATAETRFLLITADGSDARAWLEKFPSAVRARTCYLDGGQQALFAQAAARDGTAQDLPAITVQTGSRLMLARSGSCGGCGRK